MSVLEIVLYNTFRFILIFGIFTLIDFYAWTGIRIYLQNYSWFGIARIFYMCTSIFTILGFLATLLLFFRGEGVQNASSNFFMGFVFIIVIPKLFFIGFLLFEDFFRLALLGIDYLKDFGTPAVLIPRTRYISAAGLIVAAIVMIAIANGVFRNKYNYRVKRITLYFENLPASFDGYTVVQLSDVHSGSFDNTQKMEKGIELINKQHPDLVLFTGDMVNMKANEFKPYISSFAKIQAKDGKYSIFGNHDYGDYVRFKSAFEKWQNLQRLGAYEHRAGFTVLKNEHIVITRGSDSIYIAGVENWGLPPFPKRGDFKKAIEGIPDGAFTILLSHDPSHWDAMVSKQQKNIALTLSGHTHGMQFGIDLPWMRWSPVQWKYPMWGGIYRRNNMKLYVNVGFGFIGLPGRVGILPEITVITLKKK